jgi:hypothetical protein
MEPFLVASSFIDTPTWKLSISCGTALRASGALPDSGRVTSKSKVMLSADDKAIGPSLSRSL